MGEQAEVGFLELIVDPKAGYHSRTKCNQITGNETRPDRFSLWLYSFAFCIQPIF